MPKFASAASPRDWKACRSLGAIGAAALALTLTTTNLQSVIANGDTRTLSFFHTHSKESLTVTFKVNGRYDEAGLAKINHFLRDWRNHKETKMNPHLFDILWEVNRDTGGKQPIQIISAFRSPETNEMLRSRSSGVAKHSQHTLGNAIDFRIPDVALNDLRAAGLRLQRGGVGFYPGSDFVHMDTSSIRHWPRMSRDQLARVFPDGKTVHVPTDGVPLKNFQLAAAEIQQRGQFGERPGRTQIASATPAPESGALQKFITSIFSANSVANRNEVEAETEEDNIQQKQTPPARVQVASASPQALLPAVARQQQQQRDRLQWQKGPAAANEPQGPSQEPSDETTASTLAYNNARERSFPPQVRPQGTLAAVPLTAGAHMLVNGFARADGLKEMKHPETVRGFAAPVRAMVENNFQEFAPQLANDGFQRNRPQVVVVGFEPTRAASR